MIDLRRPAVARNTSPRRIAGAGLVAALSGFALLGLATAPPAAAAGADIGLGQVAPYSVLGGQTVTNTGPSGLGGDLGVSPGTALTGFPPGQVGGSTHAADAVAAQAQSDLTIAYNDAAGRAPTESVAGDLVGQTKIAGVYKSSGPLALSGTLTLDGQGDPDSVFIFQVASTLITATASYVNMINGAQACHVFWQVGSSATLGTASVFRGTIMALTSVSVTTNAVVEGRALARNGAVTLDNDVFTMPGCGTNTTTSTSPTTTTVTTTPTTATVDSTATLDATVASTGGTPTGTVTFYSGDTDLGTGAVGPTGHATLDIPTGAHAGTKVITAHYNGSVALTPSTSPATRLTVHAAPTTAPATPAAATGSTTGTATGTTGTATGTATGSTTVTAATGPRNAMGLTGAGAALLTLGFGLVWIGRRRHQALHRR